MSSIRAATSPLNTTDPADAAGAVDLEALRGIVGDVRLVGLGESAHWSAELTGLRDRILRFLVTELGFSFFALESGLPEGLAVNRWVHGGPGELSELARDHLGYGFGRCTETHDQLSWMRAHNLAAPDRPVRFVGVDVPGDCANPGPGVTAALARLPARPGDDQLRHDSDLATAADTVAPRPDASDTSGAPAGLHERIAELVDRANGAGDDLAAQCARGALAVVDFLDHGLYPAPGRNLRNEVMADNLRRLLAAAGPQARIRSGCPVGPRRHDRRSSADAERARRDARRQRIGSRTA